MARSAFSSAARKVDDLARRLQDKDVRELASETRGFARDNPTAFLAASAAVGFAAARFMRAGAEEHDDIPLGSHGDRSQGDPDTTYRTRMTERVGRADPERGRESAIGGAGSPRASAAPVGSAPSIDTRGGTR